MKPVFDPRLTERLIEAVKQSPALYDPNHVDSKDQVVKAELWTNITLQLGYESGDEHIIKARWKNMRDSFLKYKRVNNGCDTSAKNYKNWPWAPYMEFMVCCYERSLAAPRRPRTRTYGDADAAGNSDELDGEDRGSEHLHVADDTEEMDVKPSRIMRSRLRYRPPNTSSVRPLRRRRQDSVDLLFQSYAQIMKTFSAKRRALLKMRLSTLFARAELEEIAEREGDSDPLVTDLDYSEHADDTFG